MKTLDTRIADKKNEIENFEIDESKYTEAYDDMLDECYKGIFNLLPSTILERCDPIAYRVGLTDYVDSLEVEEDEDYIALLEELEALTDV